mmetsp:Transcript_25058/g.63011  ORF Transcript_25058/g.63011 Transcript_25058/m.63011 type:complete len:112 (-) Transcript_25058:741-1076(-)
MGSSDGGTSGIDYHGANGFLAPCINNSFIFTGTVLRRTTRRRSDRQNMLCVGVLVFPQLPVGYVSSCTLDKFWSELRAWKLPSTFLGFLYIASAGLSGAAAREIGHRFQDL